MPALEREPPGGRGRPARLRRLRKTDSGYSIAEPGGPRRPGTGEARRARCGRRRPLARRRGRDRPRRTLAASWSKVMIIDSARQRHYGRQPRPGRQARFVAGDRAELFWRVKPDFAVKKGLEVAFAPGFDVPDEFVEDVNRMTYSPTTTRRQGSGRLLQEEPLDQRMAKTGKPADGDHGGRGADRRRPRRRRWPNTAARCPARRRG